MTNKEKLRHLEKWLASQHIGYVSRQKHKWAKSDTFLPRYKVYIKIAGEDDEEFYYKHRPFPVFIREEDTSDFVLEKVQSAIIKSMTKRQEVLLEKELRKAASTKVQRRNKQNVHDKTKD